MTVNASPHPAPPEPQIIPASRPLIELQGLTKAFPIRKGFFNRQVGAVQAVTNVDLKIAQGETLGLVGESGCGKSTLGRCILQLIRPTSGKVLLDGETDLTQLAPRALRPLRRDIQIIFQNPYSSLDPRMTIGDTLKEPLEIHRLYRGPALKKGSMNCWIWWVCLKTPMAATLTNSPADNDNG